VPQSESITKFGELAMCVLCGIRLLQAVMQMDLDFAPTLMAMAGQTLQKGLVILLRRIKVCVTKGTAFLIAIGVGELRKHPAPIFEATLLFVVRSPSASLSRDDARLEMIGYGKDQVC
jgi:hypothetical protein